MDEELPKSNKGHRTRQRLLDAATFLVAENGRAALSVSAICERAEIGRTSFYNYFRDVDEILDVVRRGTVESFAAEFRNSHGTLPRGLKRLARCLCLILFRAAQHPLWGRLVAELGMEDGGPPASFVEDVRLELEAARAAGSISLSPETCRTYATLLADALFSRARHPRQGPADAVEVVRYVALLVTATGVGRDEAIRITEAALEEPDAAAAG